MLYNLLGVKAAKPLRAAVTGMGHFRYVSGRRDGRLLTDQLVVCKVEPTWTTFYQTVGILFVVVCLFFFPQK